MEGNQEPKENLINLNRVCFLKLTKLYKNVIKKTNSFNLIGDESAPQSHIVTFTDSRFSPRPAIKLLYI